MKTIPAFLLFASSLAAHDLATTDREALRAHILEEWKRDRGMTEVASTGLSRPTRGRSRRECRERAADGESLPAFHEARFACGR